ncbi:TPA: hypothetical protein QFP46_002507, partial [Enterococcus faecium]
MKEDVIMNTKYVFKKKFNLFIVIIQPFISQLISYFSLGSFNLIIFTRYLVMVILFIIITTIGQY